MRLIDADNIYLDVNTKMSVLPIKKAVKGVMIMCVALERYKVYKPFMIRIRLWNSWMN